MRPALLATLALLALASPAAADAQADWRAPESMQTGAQGSAQAPVTLLLTLDATGCGQSVTVPVVVGVEATEGLQAALDRVDVLVEAKPGERRLHEEPMTLSVSGAGAVTLVARPQAAPGSCLGVGGAGEARVRVEPGPVRAEPPPAGDDEGATRSIALRDADPVPPALLVTLGAVVAALARRAYRAKAWEEG